MLIIFKKTIKTIFLLLIIFNITIYTNIDISHDFQLIATGSHKIDAIAVLNDNVYFIIYMTSSEWANIWDNVIGQLPYPKWIFNNLIKGMAMWGCIFINDNIAEYRLKNVIRHEIGHLMGYEHTLRPSIMHQYRLFRWYTLDYLQGELIIFDI